MKEKEIPIRATTGGAISEFSRDFSKSLSVPLTYNHCLMINEDLLKNEANIEKVDAMCSKLLTKKRN